MTFQRLPGSLRHLRRGIGWRPSSLPPELDFSGLAMRRAGLAQPQ